MNKRADTELMSRELMFLIFVVLVAVILAAFIYIQARGYGVKEQYLAKQIALMIDSAEPGTEIKINPKDIQKIDINTTKKEIFVQAVEKSSGKRYPYFNAYKIEFKLINNKVPWILIKNEKYS